MTDPTPFPDAIKPIPRHPNTGMKDVRWIAEEFARTEGALFGRNVRAEGRVLA